MLLHNGSGVPKITWDKYQFMILTAATKYDAAMSKQLFAHTIYQQESDYSAYDTHGFLQYKAMMHDSYDDTRHEDYYDLDNPLSVNETNMAQ